MKAFNKYLLSARRIVLLAFMALSLNISAQVGEHRADFSIGINGGYALSSVGFQPNVPQGMLGGMTFGVTARYAIGMERGYPDRRQPACHEGGGRWHRTTGLLP